MAVNLYCHNMNSKEHNTMSTYKNEPKPQEEPKEGYRWVQNLMSGKWIQEPKDTPWTCSVASESYWSN